MYVLVVEGSMPIRFADWFSVRSHIDLMEAIIEAEGLTMPPFEVRLVR